MQGDIDVSDSLRITDMSEAINKLRYDCYILELKNTRITNSNKRFKQICKKLRRKIILLETEAEKVHSRFDIIDY